LVHSHARILGRRGLADIPRLGDVRAPARVRTPL
jgi:hypothetical protein